MMPTLEEALAALPLIAILRGLEPSAADAVGEVLIMAGYRIIEVPLNSPRPLDSIGRLAERFADKALIGAGTVLDARDVDAVAEAGGRLIVTPHFDAAVTRRAKELGLFAAPGVMTPSEAFAALKAGADVLKLFPGEIITPTAVAALRAVMPQRARLAPVGGIRAANIPDYVAAGADAFGIGSELFKPGRPPDEIRSRADELVRAARDAFGARARA